MWREGGGGRELGFSARSCACLDRGGWRRAGRVYKGFDVVQHVAAACIKKPQKARSSSSHNAHFERILWFEFVVTDAGVVMAGQRLNGETGVDQDIYPDSVADAPISFHDVCSNSIEQIAGDGAVCFVDGRRVRGGSVDKGVRLAAVPHGALRPGAVPLRQGPRLPQPGGGDAGPDAGGAEPRPRPHRPLHPRLRHLQAPPPRLRRRPRGLQRGPRARPLQPQGLLQAGTGSARQARL